MSKHILHHFRGELLTLTEIADRVGLTRNTLNYRMRRNKCSAEEAALMTMPERSRRFTWIDGRELTLQEISEITGIRAKTIDNRLRVGIPFLDACTGRGISRRAYVLDVVPKLTEEEKYLRDGERNQRAAKQICKNIIGIDPRKVDLREVNYWIYQFDTDSIAFEIAIRRDTATCTGKMKSNGNTLIERKYKISEYNVKEIVSNG